MSDPFATFAQAKLIATGIQLDGRVPSREPNCTSEAEFNQLVSTYYKFFREEIASDVSVLRGISDGRKLTEFDRLIKDLRTSAQHTNNPQIAQRVDRFNSAHATWESKGIALADLLEAALGELAQKAVNASRSVKDSATWKTAVTFDLTSVLSAVLSDLALSFPPWKRAFMERQIAARVRNGPPLPEFIRTVQDYCVQEIISEPAALPVPYYEVLDYLGLLGSTDAKAAVAVAYSVSQASPALRGAAYLAKVEDTWRIASSA
jgi:hypothetical protein